jgi:hypothetical protein
MAASLRPPWPDYRHLTSDRFRSDPVIDFCCPVLKPEKIGRLGVAVTVVCCTAREVQVEQVTTALALLFTLG